MKAVFEKYHCMGNDYLVYDPNKNEMELGPEQVKAVCDRNFGIGSDGILVGPVLGGEKMYVRILNPDGSEAEKSGNGMGIFARYLKDAGYVQKTKVSWDTLGGEVTVYYLNEEGTRVKISMGKPTFWSDEIPVTGIEAAKIQGYRIKNVGAGEHGREIYEVRDEKERAVLIGKVTDFTRDLFGRPIEGKSMNLSAHRSIALQMGRLAWLAAVIPLSMMLLVFEYQEAGGAAGEELAAGTAGGGDHCCLDGSRILSDRQAEHPKRIFAAGTDFGYWLLHRYSQRIPCRRRLGESEYVPGNPLMLQGWGTRIRNVDYLCMVGNSVDPDNCGN